MRESCKLTDQRDSDRAIGGWGVGGDGRVGAQDERKL